MVPDGEPVIDAEIERVVLVFVRDPPRLRVVIVLESAVFVFVGLAEVVEVLDDDLLVEHSDFEGVSEPVDVGDSVTGDIDSDSVAVGVPRECVSDFVAVAAACAVPTSTTTMVSTLRTVPRKELWKREEL